MPVISMFYGLIIAMYYLDTSPGKIVAMNPRASKANYIGDYQLLVTFKNNEQRQLICEII